MGKPKKHLWDDENRALYVGHLPGRKSVCLYYTLPGLVIPLAWFRGEEEAREAMSMIDHLARLPISPEWHGWGSRRVGVVTGANDA